MKPSEEIRKLIFSLKDKQLIGAEGQMALFFAARKFWVDGVVAKNVKKGTHVLSDRCYTSTGAYQGYAEGGDQNKILQISDVIMGEYKPDAVILLDVSSKTSMGRRVETEGDPFDKEKSEYFDKLVAGYREMAKTSWGDLNWYVVDGEPSPDRVSDSVAKVLEDIFQKKLQK